MPPGTTKYNVDWEGQDDGTNNEPISKWFSKANEYQARCNLCNCTFNIGNKGISSIKRHASQKNHKAKSAKEAAKVNVSRESTSISDLVDSEPSPSADNNISLSSTISTDNSFNGQQLTLDEQTHVAEAMWSALVAEHNIAFSTSDHATKIFHKMFPDSSIAAGFKCSRTKTNYTIVDGIATESQEKLLESIKNVPFSILIDESNKQYGKKILVILIKFYDEGHGDITTRFLDICVCNNGTADVIASVIVDFFNKNNLSFDNLIQIMSDNPNVMRGVLSGLVTQIKSKYAGHMVDIGGCSLHHVSNAIKNSLPELHNYEELEDFLQDAHAFFSFHVEFCEKKSEIQEIFDLEKHKILRYCEVRFLSVYPVVVRLIEQYKPLKKLFLEEIPKNYKKVAKQARVRRIRTALKDKFTLPTLYFIQHALEIFQKYEKLFQRSTTTIHLLYDKQIELYRTTLIYFCRLDIIEKCKCNEDLLGIDFLDSENCLKLEEFSIGSNAKKLISDFVEKDKIFFWKA
ncbi:unnamed protein product [Meganyctiphanes norvegica]|uniref:DUF4371 domain-containing protein n=1 Tax=Meganyctiphanes norvegica TaxID=48144 RepID=A0AAV2SGN1_MEGNR